MKRYDRLPILNVVAMSALFFAATIQAPIFAQEHKPDQHTLLLLHCNGNLFGAQGETPTQAQGVAFETGIFGNGAYFAPGNQVYFPGAGNLSSTEGTLEFWIKPRWNGNDGGGYVMLRFGVGGGMYFGKDGANNWKITLNRFSINNPEVGVAFNLSAWQANQWHHATFTWRSDSLKLYLDGQLLRESRVTVPLTVVNETTFQLGADFSSYYLDAVIDELRISDNVRSDKEVQAGFLAGLTISSLSIQPGPLKLVESQQQTFKLTAQTNLGMKAIPAWAAKWSSANPAIATVDENGRVTGIARGQTTVMAAFKDVSASVAVTVEPLPRALVIHDTSASPGDTIDIPLRITDASGVAGAQFVVTYDPKILTALGAQTTALTKGFLLADSVSTGKIAIAMARDTSIAGGSGSFVNLTFMVNSTAAPGETTKLTFAKLAFFDDKTNPISVTPVNGVFTVSGIKSIQILTDSAFFFVKLGGEQVFQAKGFDVNDKPVAVNASWSVDPVELGSFNPAKGDGTTFTAQSLGDGIMKAQLGAISKTAEVTVGLLGDISKDSVVDASDAFVCLRMIVGLDLPPIPPGHKTPTAYEQWAADFNEDKVINTADALLILRQSLGRLQSMSKIVAGNEDAVLRLPRIEALAGETVTAPILVGQHMDFYAAEFSLSYDPNALTLLGVTPGDTTALMAANTQELGKIKLAMIAAGGLVGKNGELVKLQFKLQRAHKNESAISMASFYLSQSHSGSGCG